MNRMYKTDITFNITYVNETKIYYIHSFVLNSDFFKIMMTETFAEQNEFSFTISHPETMNDLIKYLYTGKIDYEDFDEIRYASLY